MLIKICMKCGHKFKSKVGTKRPKCSKCGSYIVVDSTSRPLSKIIKTDVDNINSEIQALRVRVDQLYSHAIKMTNAINRQQKTIQTMTKTIERLDPIIKKPPRFRM